MKTIRALLSLSALLLVGRVFAQAPDSLVGKVYHDATTGLARNTWRGITQLRADGSCGIVMASTGSLLNAESVGALFIMTPAGDGTWTYQKTGAANGRLVIVDGNRATDALDLAFTSPTAGALIIAANFVLPSGAIPGLRGAVIGGNFTLTDGPSSDSALVSNFSMRGRVEPGRPLIAGFVVPGTVVLGTFPVNHDVLIRVVGPSLTQFGLSGTWADPDFSLYRGQSPLSGAHYRDWSGPVPSIQVPGNFISTLIATDGFKKIFNYAGAFPLLDGSKDAAQVANLSLGAYTIVCTAAAGDPGGDVIIEVYLLQ
jgi:hypothetical protein